MVWSWLHQTCGNVIHLFHFWTEFLLIPCPMHNDWVEPLVPCSVSFYFLRSLLGTNSNRCWTTNSILLLSSLHQWSLIWIFLLPTYHYEQHPRLQFAVIQVRTLASEPSYLSVPSALRWRVEDLTNRARGWRTFTLVSSVAGPQFPIISNLPALHRVCLPPTRVSVCSCHSPHFIHTSAVLNSHTMSTLDGLPRVRHCEDTSHGCGIQQLYVLSPNFVICC